jgi:hypothetical protein
MSYPQILGELETLKLVAAGKSLARFGDGEFNLCRAGRAKAQAFDVELSRLLAFILHGPDLDSARRQCLIGIPNILSDTPKSEFWKKYLNIDRMLSDRPYVSAFVTRPDSAPWINTPEYWTLMESLWIGQKVTLVRGSSHSLTADDLIGADVTEIIGPEVDAWSEYEAILTRVLATNPTRVLLCLGPTATAMAHDLSCIYGIHAIDLGHLGRFLRRLRAGGDVTSPAKDGTA